MSPPANAELSATAAAAAAHAAAAPKFSVAAPNVAYEDGKIVADYAYTSTKVHKTADGRLRVEPVTTNYKFTTDAKVPRLGVMLVGWGGNNGSTLTASIIANRNQLSWETREGTQKANYYGSLVMASTVKLGVDAEDPTKEIYVPLHDMLPMVHPNDVVIGGWDISGLNLADAMDRAKVLEPDLRRQVRDEMRAMVPLPSVYYPDFIASNQEERADNVLPGNDKQAHLDRLRQDMRDFKAAHDLDKLVVLWTANTERFADLVDGVNDSADNLLAAIARSEDEVSPSTVFAVASILEGHTFINGSPQNTFVPGVIELAERHRVQIGGDDFKSGQTKVKSVIVDFLVNAGIKPLSIASYNHLGNNDGRNLSEHKQFRSKEISKSSVVDDMVAANPILYADGEHPDHIVVIKYVPSVGDSKRALDEYNSEIFMGGRNTLSMFNTCEDSLLASPLIIDLFVLGELFSRVQYQAGAMAKPDFLHSVLSPLSYMLKAPLVPAGTPIINSLPRQRNGLEAFLRALVGLPVNNEANLEYKCFH
ncbi:Myo-inositol-1-phosphate synthase [Blastocladiella emersonii ATCC 22665]|nr:Myo-inositol-1-phosphate synthase [Blastocladiella emersonii ATCC 22665]